MSIENKLKLYNSLTGNKEIFEPLEDKKVKIYACGITVYDEAHIGHARQAIAFDVIKRYLTFLGFDVTYVRNFTDVDDKIIKRANERGVTALELSEHFIAETRKDLNLLNVFDADYEPKVTDHIADIISFIEGLIAKGYAYVSEGEVFFEVSKFAKYGELSNRKVDEGLVQEENPRKKHPADFSLWKPAKQGEVSRESPWGAGRPGWHIECSAMAYKYLGDSIDIHGGGLDLVFPHHENEIAQSEAFTGKTFAKYWVHNGLVNVDGRKMSKSLGNFTTIKEALAEYNPESIRFLFINYKFGAPMDYSDETLQLANKRLYYFYKSLNAIDELLVQENIKNDEIDSDIMQGFCDAMNDDFNFSKVFVLISGVFTDVNKILDDKSFSDAQKANALVKIRNTITKIGSILGVFNQAPQVYLKDVEDRVLKKKGMDRAQVDNMIAARTKYKNEKNYQAADKVRDELVNNGILLKDGKDATTWEVDFS